MKNIIVLVSGGGTNLQALLDAQDRGEIKNGKITCVISSNPNAYALTRAANHGVETEVIRRRDYAAFDDYDAALTAASSAPLKTASSTSIPRLSRRSAARAITVCACTRKR